MTTSGISELFGFARRRSRKNGSASLPSGWKVACALLLLCAATAIVSPAQTFRALGDFDGTNGAFPNSLVQGLDGTFYGTTQTGGAYYGGGTVFKITPGGTLTTLYNFSGGADGYYPDGLIQATDGNFYGLTLSGGGSPTCPFPDVGCGTVFK